jgi:hypothetical protein
VTSRSSLSLSSARERRELLCPSAKKKRERQNKQRREKGQASDKGKRCGVKSNLKPKNVFFSLG